MIRATALLFSSHNRCEHIHRDWLVQRALESHDNKTFFYIPFSMGRYDQQHYSWGTFEWYLKKFEKYGLRSSTFFWSDEMRREDVDVFFHKLWHDQVVVLGGGNSILGMERYRELGAMYYRDPGLFERILHERQDRGLLTAGFSAGSDQLGEFVHEAAYEPMPNPRGFGLATNVMTTLHHEQGREDGIKYIAEVFPQCLVFGLPNDSGLAVDQGRLGSGNTWQLLEFIVDKSWDLANDRWHIKTRMGMKIDHFYRDGRHWSLGGGDRMIRIMSPDGRAQRVWVKPVHGPFYDYWTQQPTGYQNIDQILANH